MALWDFLWDPDWDPTHRLTSTTVLWTGDVDDPVWASQCLGRLDECLPIFATPKPTNYREGLLRSNRMTFIDNWALLIVILCLSLYFDVNLIPHAMSYIVFDGRCYELHAFKTYKHEVNHI